MGVEREWCRGVGVEREWYRREGVEKGWCGELLEGDLRVERKKVMVREDGKIQNGWLCKW